MKLCLVVIVMTLLMLAVSAQHYGLDINKNVAVNRAKRHFEYKDGFGGWDGQGLWNALRNSYRAKRQANGLKSRWSQRSNAQLEGTGA